MPQYIELPQVGVIGPDITCSLQEIAHAAVQTAVIQEFALGKCKPFISNQNQGIVHEHIHKQRTQFLTGLVAAREKLLIITGTNVTCQFD